MEDWTMANDPSVETNHSSTSVSNATTNSPNSVASVVTCETATTSG